MIAAALLTRAAPIGAATLAALLALQTWRLHTEQIAHRDLIAATAKADAARTQAALQHEQKTAAAEYDHATRTQENADAYTATQPARDAAHRADLGRVERLRLDAERRAATYRAQAQASAAACSDLADQHAALDAHIVRGAAVVAGLTADLDRRDAEVTLLRRQVDVERELSIGADNAF